jgi:prepilin-type N-terminal cleavage/methylation domain-containing protein
METKSPHRSFECRSESGLTLIETMIAVAILLIISVGLLSVGVVAVTTTENQGHLAARTAEYAQDKMEQLLSLAYTNTQADTTCGVVTCNTGGSGLTNGGSIDPAAPVTTPGTGYVDYLCADGNPSGVGGCTAANWYYIRVWKIEAPAGTTNLKQITVTCAVRFDVAGRGTVPQATLTTLKTSPF